jgi:hypothetical protein
MTRYSVSGTLTPDATTPDTGEPAGTYDAQPYWSWTNDAGTWYLWWYFDGIGGTWEITNSAPGPGFPWWVIMWTSALLEGEYHANIGAAGTATVAEYVPPADDTPDDFSFLAVVDADPETQYVSDSAEVTGMDAGTAISVENGEYRVNGGAWTSDAGTIDPGDTLELRGTSSGEPKGVVAVSVTVGTLAKEWTVETRQARRFRFVCEGFVF